MDSAPIIQFDKLVIPKKNYSRDLQIKSDKKNKYKISIFNHEDKLKINAIKLDSEDIKGNEFEKELLINELKNNKYLSLCETIDDMLEELFNLIDNKKYSLKEIGSNEIIFFLEVPMKLIKEICFNLVRKEKDANSIINELIKENKELKNKIEILSLQTRDLKDDIDYLKEKNIDDKIKEINTKVNDKFDNFELKINQQKMEEQKEKKELISQVNILTKKVLKLEQDLEQERNNNKKFQEHFNNQIKNLNSNLMKLRQIENNNNQIEKQNNTPNNPPFHSSKSESLPQLIFESFLGEFLGVNPDLGKKGRSKFHEHVLVYSNYQMKDPSYAKGTYYCDHCKDEFSKNVNNFHCKPCHFDLCERCFKISQY